MDLEGLNSMFIVRCNEDHSRFMLCLTQHLKSRQPRHFDIKQNDIGQLLIDQGNSGLSVVRLSDNQKIIPTVQDSLYSLA